MSPQDEIPEESGPELTLDLRTAPVPREIEEPWRKLVQAHRRSKSLRVIYRAVVLDQSWQQAANEEQADKQNAWNMARRFGLAGKKRRQLIVDRTQRINELASDELEQRLLHQAEDISSKDLNAIWGTSLDKLSREWDRKEGGTSTYVSLLDRLAKQLEEGGSIQLEMTVSTSQRVVDTVPATRELESGLELG